MTQQSSIKIEQLTSEQEAALPAFRQKYLDITYGNGRTDRYALEAALADAYALIGRPAPQLFIFDSPVACMHALEIFGASGVDSLKNLVDDQLGDQASDQLWSQIGQRLQLRDRLWKHIGGRIEGQPWDQLRNQLWAHLHNQPWDQLKGQLRDWLKGQLGDCLVNRLKEQGQLGDELSNQIEGQFGSQFRERLKEQLGDLLGDQSIFNSGFCKTFSGSCWQGSRNTLVSSWMKKPITASPSRSASPCSASGGGRMKSSWWRPSGR